RGSSRRLPFRARRADWYPSSRYRHSRPERRAVGGLQQRRRSAAPSWPLSASRRRRDRTGGRPGTEVGGTASASDGVAECNRACCARGGGCFSDGRTVLASPGYVVVVREDVQARTERRPTLPSIERATFPRCAAQLLGEKVS